jgi:hypothetical protein
MISSDRARRERENKVNEREYYNSVSSFFSAFLACVYNNNNNKEKKRKKMWTRARVCMACFLSLHFHFQERAQTTSIFVSCFPVDVVVVVVVVVDSFVFFFATFLISKD